MGDEGQERLRASHAVVVGCGALGSVQAELLVRAGVGTITLVDRDVVEWSNLQRQTLYDERDAERAVPKAEAAKRRLREIDSSARIHACVEHVDAANVTELARGAHAIIDGLDNAATRYLLNDVAVRERVPFIHAAAVGMEGRSLAVLEGRPCLRCIFPFAPEPGALGTCDTVGVFAPVVNMAGAFAAAQALRVLAGRGDLVARGLWSVDLGVNRFATIGALSEPTRDCPCCHHRRFEWLEGAPDGATTLCGRNAVQIAPVDRGSRRAGAGVDLPAVRRRLDAHGSFVEEDGRLRGRFTTVKAPDGNSVELLLFADGRAIIAGSIDATFARSVYDRFVGS